MPPFERIPVATPPQALEQLRQLGLLHHGPNRTAYWRTDAAYVIGSGAANALLDTAARLQARCEEAVAAVVESGDYSHFGIPHPAMRDAIARSWRARETPLYGRMDFSYGGDGQPRLLDYEAENPFGLSEASYGQWEWFEAWQAASGRNADTQENLIHEKLTALLPRLNLPPDVILAHGETAAEQFDAGYLAELAREARLAPRLCTMSQIGWDREAKRFTDAQGEPGEAMVKLYPWDWMEEEPNVDALPESRTRILPAAWTRLLGDKTLLALLWRLFPGEPALLPCFLEPPGDAAPMVAKPRRGWDGEHVFLPGQPIRPVPETEVGPLLHQAYCPLPRPVTKAGAAYAAVSVWLIGGEPAGLSFRESDGPVTGTDARFVPHILRD